MSKTDFDRYAETYYDLLENSVRLSGYDAAFFADRKAREIAQTLADRGIPTAGLRFLNFGCGIGSGEPALVRHLPGASIFAIDVSRKSLDVARERNRKLSEVSFGEFDGRHIPFPGSFDVILLAGVLHHIPPTERPDILRILFAALSAQGLLFLFEHNPWNPLTRKVVKGCPFDEEAQLVPARSLRKLLTAVGFGRCDIRFIHFFPRLLRVLVPLERWLQGMPLGAQYYCVAARRA